MRTLAAVLVLASGCSREKPEQQVEQPIIEPEQPTAPAAPPELTPEDVDPFLSLDAPSDVAEAPADARRSKSGLAWKVIREGEDSARGGPEDTAWVHYTSWHPDGKRASTSRKKESARELRIGKMVPGWKETLLGMAVGERRRVWMPSKLAHTRSKRRKGGPRTVDFELIKLVIAPDPPPDVKKPPRSARKSASGLRWVVLKPGDGEKPAAGSSVTVRYAGWTTDGSCFDHTPDDEEMTFSLASVIPGWSEGMQDMRTGEKRRFWIPKKLAYDGQHGKPKGTLVFDIELVSHEAAGSPE